MSRDRWAKVVLSITLLWLMVMLVSLRTGWLNGLFFDGSHAHVQGVDFFPVARAWLNLAAGHSEYDTFQSGYGPYATWLVYHPALALLLGPLLAWLKPWTAYRVWTALSVLLMAAAACVLAQRGADPLRRALMGLLLLGAFPTYVTFYSGNVQALLVFAGALIFASVDAMRDGTSTPKMQAMLLAGLLISLFSKPIVLAMLPMLLVLPQTRRAAARSIAIYAAVSLLSLLLPAWNPVSMSWAERGDLLLHPAVVAQTMNVYTNHFQVTKPMQDNAIHWLAMRGLADFRMLHIDVYSLPALLDGWLRMHTPESLYRVPLLLVFEVTLLVALVRERRAQMDAALMTLMAASLLLLLSYGLVWEYHYTSVLPVAGLLLLREPRGWMERTILWLSLLAWAPGLYFAFHQQSLELLGVQTFLRAERVVPAALIFLLLLARATTLALTSAQGLRLIPAAMSAADRPAAQPGDAG